MIQYSRAPVMESKGRCVLDTRFRGYDGMVLGLRFIRPLEL
jgi:hypothetical protein